MPRLRARVEELEDLRTISWGCVSACMDVLDLLAAGRARAGNPRRDYPDLEAEDVKACLEYAAAQLDHPVLVASR